MHMNDQAPRPPPALSTLFRTVITNILAATATTILGLTFEYWSGWFLPATSSSLQWSSLFRTVLVSASLLALVLFTKDAMLALLRPHRYVREHFALLAFLTGFWLIATTVLSISLSLMPWSVPLLIFQMINGLATAKREVPLPGVHWSESCVLVLADIMILMQLRKWHTTWSGLKSVEQHKRQQRGEPAGLVHEASLELKRLLRRQLPFQAWIEASRPAAQQLEPAIDSLAWKDQAKELLRLSSTSYAFGKWHDKEQCWVGQNVSAGDVFFLRPCEEDLSDAELAAFLSHVDRIAASMRRKVDEIIVASRGAESSRMLAPKGRSVRFESEDSLLTNLIDFKDYFNDIRRRASVSRLPDSDLTLADVYVPSRLHSSDDFGASTSVEEYLDGWLGEPGQRQIALLGEYGQGKSTAALMWAHRLIVEGMHKSGRIPLLIELRGTSPRNLTTLQFVGAWAAQYNINAQAVMRLLIAGRVVLILEGFDEMALVGDAEMRLKHFRTLWQFAYPRAKVLITGRPNFFLDEDERKAALGISKPNADRPYCVAVRLAPFSSVEVRSALRGYKSAVRKQILLLHEKNARLRDLVSRPSLLHLVAVLWEREKLFEKLDKLTSAYVIDLFVRHSYRRQGRKEEGSPEFMALTTMEREYFMSGIAAFMAAHRLPNQIASAQLTDVVTSLLQAIPDSISTCSPAISGETRAPLRRRVLEAEYGVEHIKTDVRACGLLVDDPASLGTFRFGHKSFMELLFAAVVFERLMKPNSERAGSLLLATGADIEDIAQLPVSVEFLSELLVTEDDRKSSPETTSDSASSARRLFRAIVVRGGLPEWCWRALVLIALHDRFFAARAPLAHKILGQSGAHMTMLFASMVGAVSSLYTLPPNNSAGTSSLFMVIMIIGMTISILGTWASMVWARTGRRRCGLWVNVCRGIGMQDDLLHQAAGSSRVPWLRVLEFEFCFGMPGGPERNPLEFAD